MPIHSTFLQKPRSLQMLLGISLLWAFLWMFFLWPESFTWMGYQNATTADTAQHLSGWYAFMRDSWHFPLLKTLLLDAPQGTNISLTDSLPLLALLFKPFQRFLPLAFNDYALLFVVYMMLQSSAAALLAWSLNQKNLLANIAFCFFALSAPILTYRIGIADSLCCQFIILFALSLYFFNHQQRLSLQRAHVYFGLLLGAALLIHPYLAAMSYPFYWASLYELQGASRAQKWKYVACMHGLLLLECLIFGLDTGTQAVVGFGILNMNLLAPVYGGWLFHDRALLALPTQWEGFAYLGWGLILMFILACFLQRASLRTLCKNYRPLLIATFLLFIFAIYGSIDLGSIHIIRIGAPHFFLTYDFRTNGRFFWPCFYLIMGFSLKSVLSKRPNASLLILPALLLVQVFDTSGYTLIAKAALTQNMQAPSAQIQAISALVQQSQAVVIYPPMACPYTNEGNLALMQYLAAKAGVPINTAYTAHFESSDHCHDEAPLFAKKAALLLVSPLTTPSETIKQQLKTAPSNCQIIGAIFYCLVNHHGA